MLPVDRVKIVMWKLYMLNDIHIVRNRLYGIIDSALELHSSRQGKVVFVHAACELLNACPKLFRWIHGTLPR